MSAYPAELRTMPASIDAEANVLGALMIDPKALAKIADWLSEGDFYRRDHQLIYRGICHLAERNQPCDAITLAEWFEGEGVSEDVGGSGYIIELASTAMSAANIVAYAEIVLEKSRLRQVADLGMRIANSAMEGGASADLVAQSMHTLSELSTERRGGLQPLKPALKEWFTDLADRYESGKLMYGRATPWHDVNELTRGLRGGELTVIAARPGMGKSVMGFGLATFDALREGGRTAVFSLEMTQSEFVQREVSALGGVPHEWLRAPTKQDGDEQWARVTSGMTTLHGANLLIDDTPALTVAQIAARARRAHMQSPLSMVVVDHLHIVRIKGDNPVRELGDVSRGLKALAKELNVPVVALAQLNRGNTQRADKRPTMPDLRGSGEIEQDADYILLLHRDDYYDDSTERAGVMEVIVGKSRNAAANAIHLRSRLDVMRFDDWEGPLPNREEPKNHWRTGRGFEA